MKYQSRKRWKVGQIWPISIFRPSGTYLEEPCFTQALLGKRKTNPRIGESRPAYPIPMIGSAWYYFPHQLVLNGFDAFNWKKLKHGEGAFSATANSTMMTFDPYTPRLRQDDVRRRICPKIGREKEKFPATANSTVKTVFTPRRCLASSSSLTPTQRFRHSHLLGVRAHRGFWLRETQLRGPFCSTTFAMMSLRFVFVTNFCSAVPDLVIFAFISFVLLFHLTHLHAHFHHFQPKGGFNFHFFKVVTGVSFIVNHLLRPSRSPFVGYSCAEGCFFLTR